MLLYKVLKNPVIDGVYHSAISQFNSRVEYHLDEWSSAPQYLADRGYHLLVFARRKDARKFKQDFLGRRGNYSIWIVEVGGVVLFDDELPRILYGGDFNDSDQLARTLSWLELPPDGWKSKLHSKWPPGTVMAERVKLVRKAT